VGDADTAVGEAVAAGATLIKVTAHAGGPMLSAKVMAAVVSAAHAARAASPQTHFRNSGFGAGVPVVVHAEGPGTVAAALDAGADLLAHTPWTEEVDDGLIRASAASMTWISTLDIHGWGEETPARIRAVANLRAFHGYGGNVLYGTDLGNGPLPPAINAREIRALQSAGLTPAEVLAAMIDTDGEPGWIAGGLDLDPARFSDVMATARVLGPEVRPRS
jgi:imidazolonepropionase-like amidohydrolase